jgi:hypothetical protein
MHSTARNRHQAKQVKVFLAVLVQDRLLTCRHGNCCRSAGGLTRDIDAGGNKVGVRGSFRILKAAYSLDEPGGHIDLLDGEALLHDSATGKEWSYEFVDKLTGTYANPSTCQIGFHWKQTRSGEAVTDKETYLDLTGGTKADVLTLDQYLTGSAAKSGHDSWDVKVSPSLFVLHVTKSDTSESNYVFPDEDIANHLAKALTHAAELCESTQSAGNPARGKEPF